MTKLILAVSVAALALSTVACRTVYVQQPIPQPATAVRITDHNNSITKTVTEERTPKDGGGFTYRKQEKVAREGGTYDGDEFSPGGDEQYFGDAPLQLSTPGTRSRVQPRYGTVSRPNQWRGSYYGR